MPTIQHPDPEFTGVVQVGARRAKFVDGRAEVTIPHAVRAILARGCTVVADDTPPPPQVAPSPPGRRRRRQESDGGVDD